MFDADTLVLSWLLALCVVLVLIGGWPWLVLARHHTVKSKSKLRLKANMTITDNPAEVFVVKWSPEGNMLAAGLGDGSIRVRHTHTQAHTLLPPHMDRQHAVHPSRHLYASHLHVAHALTAAVLQVFNTDTGYTHLLNTGHKFAFPVTSLRFRPMSTASKTKNVLLSVSTCTHECAAPLKPRR